MKTFTNFPKTIQRQLEKGRNKQLILSSQEFKDLISHPLLETLITIQGERYRIFRLDWMREDGKFFPCRMQGFFPYLTVVKYGIGNKLPENFELIPILVYCD